LLNLWLLKVMLSCVRDGVTTIKPRHETTESASGIRSDELSFKLLPTSERVYVWRTPKETYNPEWLVPTVKHGDVLWGFEQQYRGILLIPLLPFMVELLQGNTWTGWVIRCIPLSRRDFRTTMQFSMTTVPPFTHLELFPHGLDSMKVKFNIFPGQHNH
jgi:hypothetical protein